MLSTYIHLRVCTFTKQALCLISAENPSTQNETTAIVLCSIAFQGVRYRRGNSEFPFLFFFSPKRWVVSLYSRSYICRCHWMYAIVYSSNYWSSRQWCKFLALRQRGHDNFSLKLFFFLVHIWICVIKLLFAHWVFKVNIGFSEGTCICILFLY